LTSRPVPTYRASHGYGYIEFRPFSFYSVDKQTDGQTDATDQSNNAPATGGEDN